MSAGALESESIVKEQGYHMPLVRLASRGQTRGLLLSQLSALPQQVDTQVKEMGLYANNKSYDVRLA